MDNYTTCSHDLCINGSRQAGTSICGLNGEGVLFEECVNGQWIETWNALVLMYVVMVKHGRVLPLVVQKTMVYFWNPAAWVLG